MRFVSRPVLTILTALALAALIALGVWQLQRLAWKRELIAKVEARAHAAPIPFDRIMARAAAGEDIEYAPVRLDGVYAHDLQAFVFGLHDGAPGVFVFTPLDSPAAAPSGEAGRGSRNEPLGRRFVYVNRGFLPQSLRSTQALSQGEIKGEVVVEGLLRTAEAPGGFLKLIRARDQPEDNLWFVRDPRRPAAHHNIETVPYYIDSFGRENPAAWPKGGTTRLQFSNRHLEYALTWFGLAAALLGVYLAFSTKRS